MPLQASLLPPLLTGQLECGSPGATADMQTGQHSRGFTTSTFCWVSTSIGLPLGFICGRLTTALEPLMPIGLNRAREQIGQTPILHVSLGTAWSGTVIVSRLCSLHLALGSDRVPSESAASLFRSLLHLEQIPVGWLWFWKSYVVLSAFLLIFTASSSVTKKWDFSQHNAHVASRACSWVNLEVGCACFLDTGTPVLRLFGLLLLRRVVHLLRSLHLKIVYSSTTAFMIFQTCLHQNQVTACAPPSAGGRGWNHLSGPGLYSYFGLCSF